jgi:hypothetical protein
MHGNSHDAEREYHFKKLPLPKKMTVTEAENYAEKLNNALYQFRHLLYEFYIREGYKLLGYKNMPAFIKAKLHELTPRYANSLLTATATEIKMQLSSQVGRVPYLAIKILNPFSDKRKNILWRLTCRTALHENGRIKSLRNLANKRKK